jgi:hypothetical protein
VQPASKPRSHVPQKRPAQQLIPPSVPATHLTNRIISHRMPPTQQQHRPRKIPKNHLNNPEMDLSRSHPNPQKENRHPRPLQPRQPHLNLTRPRPLIPLNHQLHPQRLHHPQPANPPSPLPHPPAHLNQHQIILLTPQNTRHQAREAPGAAGMHRTNKIDDDNDLRRRDSEDYEIGVCLLFEEL